jgi:uncharacterized protein (TIGR00299 family) protein
MRLAYLEPFAGISGDMFLGALVDAGVSPDLLRVTLATLHLGAQLEVERVDRSGISATKAHILVDGRPAETSHEHGHHHHNEPGGLQAHVHDHPRRRSLSTILQLLDQADLPKPVRALASRTFERLGLAEAKIHQVPVESIHFHEVGAVDAIADIVLAAAGVHALQIDAWHCSPLNVGGGAIECAHGRFPVPAPATAELLLGCPTYSSGPAMELVTPTGAALVRALECAFGPAPALRVDTIGYGAGTRNPPGFSNVLRLSIGEAEVPDAISSETVTVLETAVDDLNPQVVAYVAEQAFKLGALDVMCTPVLMKKNRSGTLITILANPCQTALFESLLLRETSTLGVRIHQERRVRLEREHVTVPTPWGAVRIKRGLHEGQELNAAPEFEDCRKIAEAHAIPLKHVLETALRAFRQHQP